MPKLTKQTKLDEFDDLGDLEELNPYLAQLHRKLSSIKLTYQILHFSPDEVDDIYEVQMFESPEEAFKFYISLDEELAPQLRCTISGTLGNFSYSCMAPLTLRSLLDIADAEDELPPRVKDMAIKALARKIYYDLPFNTIDENAI
jgi:hypothetical protein